MGVAAEERLRLISGRQKAPTSPKDHRETSQPFDNRDAEANGTVFGSVRHIKHRL